MAGPVFSSGSSPYKTFRMSSPFRATSVLRAVLFGNVSHRSWRDRAEEWRMWSGYLCTPGMLVRRPEWARRAMRLIYCAPPPRNAQQSARTVTMPLVALLFENRHAYVWKLAQSKAWVQGLDAVWTDSVFVITSTEHIDQSVYYSDCSKGFDSSSRTAAVIVVLMS